MKHLGFFTSFILLGLVGTGAQIGTAAIIPNQVKTLPRVVKLDPGQSRLIDRELAKVGEKSETVTVLVQCHRYKDANEQKQKGELTCYATSAIPDPNNPPQR